MSLSKTSLLPSLAGAVALTLALMLGGCGQSTSTDTTETKATEEAATDEAAAASEDEITIPENLSFTSDATRALADSNDTTAAEGFDALPTSEHAETEGLLSEDELTSADGDEASKPATGYTTLQDGGIIMTLPSNWLFTQDEDGFVYQTRSGNVWGFMYSRSKTSNTQFDVQQLACSVPSTMAQRGATDIEVYGYETLYSEKGTLCSAYVLYSFKIDGITYTHYVQYVESRSYLNIVEFLGDEASFIEEIDAIADATGSIMFIDGEVI